MTQAVSMARQLNCQSACTTIWFAPTTAAANPPIAIPARAARTRSMACGIHRGFEITPSSGCRVLLECEMGLAWLPVAWLPVAWLPVAWV